MRQFQTEKAVSPDNIRIITPSNMKESSRRGPVGRRYMGLMGDTLVVENKSDRGVFDMNLLSGVIIGVVGTLSVFLGVGGLVMARKAWRGNKVGSVEDSFIISESYEGE